MAHGPRRGLDHARRAGRGARSVERPGPQRAARHPVVVHESTAGAVLPGPDRVQPLQADADVTRGVSARAGAGAALAVRRAAVLWLAALTAPPLALGQVGRTGMVKAGSLRLAGRPCHPAGTMLSPGARA